MTPDEIQKVDAALKAHGAWLIRLRTAIDKGSSEFKPDTVRLDNACDFGKWLYGDFPQSKKGTPDYEEIRQLHASFHRHAADILTLALAGNKAEASRLLEFGGEFMSISGSLVLKLKRLKG